jgi:hypothetical protein
MKSLPRMISNRTLRTLSMERMKNRPRNQVDTPTKALTLILMILLLLQRIQGELTMPQRRLRTCLRKALNPSQKVLDTFVAFYAEIDEYFQCLHQTLK